MQDLLLQHPQIWNGRTSGSVDGSPPGGSDGPPHQWLIGGAVVGLVALVLIGGLLSFVIRPEEPSPSPLPGIPEESVEGPIGKVTLRDYPDGRKWLTWWHKHRHWAGSPLWVDKPFRELASCAGFEATIICWNTDQQVKGSEWELSQLFLGTQAMTRAHLQPQQDAQPAEIVNNYILDLASHGEDVWYRFGAIQSPAISSGGIVVQLYQFARLEWPADASPSEVGKVRLTPLGKIAAQERWG